MIVHFMAKSNLTFNKREKEKRRQKKKKEKQQRKEERQANSAGGGLENMIAYVDEYGNIVDTPPDLSNKKKIDASKIEIGVPKREKEEVELIRKGRVEHFNHDRGYGFIKDLDNEAKYFVHVHDLQAEVDVRDLVSFEVQEGEKGLRAVKVQKL
ncbi:MAG: cold shock domain-containing protein [Bacteroidota bacterium]